MRRDRQTCAGRKAPPRVPFAGQGACDILRPTAAYLVEVNMAFCTSCGATLEGTGQFCTKCGAGIAGGPGPQTAAASPGGAAAKPAMVPAPGASVPGSGGGALKVILIVAAVILGIVVLGGAVIGFGAWRLMRSSHIETGKDGARIETPFGTVESNTNTAAALRKLGVDVYPGARQLPGAAAVSMGA